MYCVMVILLSLILAMRANGRLDSYGKCSKIVNIILFLISKKCWLSGLDFTKCLSE